MKNQSETICNKQKRQLTAKANKFVTQCSDIALNKKGINRYCADARPIQNKVKELLHYLFFELEYSISQAKEVISNRIEKNTLN
jgi:hypothetical protein